MEYKAFPIETKEIDSRTVTGIAAVFGNIDNGGDRIHRGSFSKTIQENMKRVKALWQHRAADPPVAVVKDLQEVSAHDLPAEIRDKHTEVTGGLLVRREYLETERGNEILAGIKAGAITEMSIGYDPLKWDMEELLSGEHKGLLVRNLREVRLWDVSDVNFGMNELTVAVKTALPFRDTGKAPEDEGWSAPALADFTDGLFDDLSDAEKRRIAAHYAWTANNPPQTFGDLKLPHHRPVKSGVGPAVWRGVAASMAALMGARGGVQVPAGDRDGIYAHLARHYEQFDREAPAKSLVKLSAILPLVDEIKAGRVLSARNLNRLKDALAVLEEILLAAEPPETDEEEKQAPPAPALTPDFLRAQLSQKIEIAERELSLGGV